MALDNGGSAENDPSRQVCRVDGHVHIHPDFPISRVLDSACRNMGLAVSPERATGVLLLTEMAGVDRFGALPDHAGDWSIIACAEAMSVVARRDDGSRLFIVAGRQIVTAEGLEVLANGTVQALPDGLPLTEVMAAVRDLGALAVLPWGVGKWTGGRGRIMKALAARPPASDGFFLADSGVRLTGTPRPGILAQGEANGWRVLTGSDPLPLRNQAAAAGRYGFVAECALDPDRPFHSLAAWLRALERSPDCYGALRGLGGFVAHQTAMQIRKRLG
ncbi:hypothetical protein [Ruegeria jejuensis]|uniref:hypothetical protein n=1 Tax=Ruegeria jejuensis TaxID=3233338 RepID=UPI00355B460A